MKKPDVVLTKEELIEKSVKAADNARKVAALAEKIQKSKDSVAARHEKIVERERKVEAALSKLTARHETALKKLSRYEARAEKFSEAAKNSDSGSAPEGT